MLLDIMGEQILDPFRVGMLFFLVLTARNTVHATGTLVPLAAGALFIAVIIPLTFAPEQSNFWTQVLAGLVTNAAVLAVIVLLFAAFDRSRAHEDRS